MARTAAISPLTLGTATLGMAYGVTNPDRAMSEPEAHRILDGAWAAGITTLDTAPAYGAAEARIGTWIRRTGHRPYLATKLSALGDIADIDIRRTVEAAVLDSLGRFGVERIDAYLVHSAADFTRPAVRDALQALKATGLLAAAGVSVYDPPDVFAALETGAVDVIQLPLNLFDRRMLESGALAACAKAGITVFVRSAFLQGVLLAEPETLPEHLAGLRPAVARLREIAAGAGTSPQNLALHWLQSQTGIGSTIVGVASAGQLAVLADAASAPAPDKTALDALGDLAGSVPAGLADPRHWTARR